jgi:hypothetical protein
MMAKCSSSAPLRVCAGVSNRQLRLRANRFEMDPRPFDELVKEE